MGYDGHVIFDALYLRRKCRCRFAALPQTSLNISACISQVLEVSIHKFTNIGVGTLFKLGGKIFDTGTVIFPDTFLRRNSRK